MQLKTFSFSKVEALFVSDTSYAVDATVDTTLADEEGIWFSDEQIDFTLRVAPEVADYFRRRRLVANQSVVRKLAGGGLILSIKAGHPNQVLPLVRYWLPHIEILGPENMRQKLRNELAEYLVRVVDRSAAAEGAMPL